MGGPAQKVEAIYEQPSLAHAPMEPVTCPVHVRRDGCDIWVGTQVPTFTKTAAAKVTGLPKAKVRVHNHLLGGGFGRRLEVDFITRAVQIAQQVPGPVQVFWSREEDIQHDVYRPYYYDRIAAGLDARGQPIAWTHRIVGPSIIARWGPPPVQDGIDPDALDGAGPLLYDIPAIPGGYLRPQGAVGGPGV